MKHRKRKRLLVYAGLALLNFLVFFVIPIRPYHPNCGGLKRPIYLKGPLRPEYQEQLERALLQDGIYYWKIESRIYLRYFDTLDKNSTFGSRYGLFSNGESKIIEGMATALQVPEELPPPPPALLTAIRATEHKYGTFDPDSSANNAHQFEDCDVMRAGAIWTDKLDAEAETTR